MGLFKTKTVLLIVFSYSNPLALTAGGINCGKHCPLWSQLWLIVFLFSNPLLRMAGGNWQWKTPSIVITAGQTASYGLMWSYSHPGRIGWKALARSGPDDSCILACFWTGSIWPKPGTISHNETGSGLVLYAIIRDICGRMQPSLKMRNR